MDVSSTCLSVQAEASAAVGAAEETRDAEARRAEAAEAAAVAAAAAERAARAVSIQLRLSLEEARGAAERKTHEAESVSLLFRYH